MNEKDTEFLREAIEESKKSVEANGFPVGVVIVMDGEIIARGVSDGKQLKDATSHAEIAAIRNASQKLNTRELRDTTLYSSLEPCLMCLAASYWAYIPRIVFACRREKVSSQHYEGKHDIKSINAAFLRPIELVHIPELEKEALRVIQNWEE